MKPSRRSLRKKAIMMRRSSWDVEHNEDQDVAYQVKAEDEFPLRRGGYRRSDGQIKRIKLFSSASSRPAWDHDYQDSGVLIQSTTSEEKPQESTLHKRISAPSQCSSLRVPRRTLSIDYSSARTVLPKDFVSIPISSFQQARLKNRGNTSWEGTSRKILVQQAILAALEGDT